jgi:hypothetical protein
MPFVCRDGRDREGKGVQGLFIKSVISAFVLGLFLGVLLGYSVLQGWRLRVGRKRDIDRLLKQFQALFRQIDQEKHQHP